MRHIEEFRTIAGHEQYQVSNCGRVRNALTGEIVKKYINKSTGYLYVSLYDKDTHGRALKSVHRLVAEAFLPNPNNLEQVDHKDGAKTHNCVSNLRWVTRKFNNSRPRARKLKSLGYKDCRALHKDDIVKAEKDGVVKWYKNPSQASKELGFSHVLAIKVLRGEFHSGKGWRLSYVNRYSPEGMCSVSHVRFMTPKQEKKEEYKKAVRRRRSKLAGREGSRIVSQHEGGVLVNEWPDARTASEQLDIPYKAILAAAYGFGPDNDNPHEFWGSTWSFKLN